MKQLLSKVKKSRITLFLLFTLLQISFTVPLFLVLKQQVSRFATNEREIVTHLQQNREKWPEKQGNLHQQGLETRVSWFFLKNSWMIPLFFAPCIWIPFVLIRKEKKRDKQEKRSIIDPFGPRFEQLVALSADAVFLLDREHNIIFWNEEAFKIFGYSVAEAIGMDPKQLLVTKVDLFPEKLAVKVHKVTVDCLHKSGESFPVELTLTNFNVQNHHYILVNAKPMTIKLQQQAELSHLWAAIEYTSEIMILTDNQSKVLYVNPSFQKNTGYSRHEVTGKPFYRFLRKDYTSEFYREIRDTLHKKEQWYGTVKYRKKDNTPLLFRCSISPILDPDGSISSYVIIANDITLEHKQEMQVRQAQKLESLGTLSAGIAHDFNNILGSIVGFTELSMDDVPEDSLTHKNLKQVLKASFRARDLVSQILMFSKQSKSEKIPLQLFSLVKETIKLLQASVPSIKVRFNAIGDVSMIQADPATIHQLLLNLFTNAVQSMNEKGTLTISIENVMIDHNFTTQYSELKVGEHIKLTISDTGHGIPPKIIDQIFDPFFSTRKNGESTGLGLSVVHGIVKGHNGLITVSSNPGEGSTFEIYFPCLTMPDDFLTTYNYKQNK